MVKKGQANWVDEATMQPRTMVVTDGISEKVWVAGNSIIDGANYFDYLSADFDQYTPKDHLCEHDAGSQQMQSIDEVKELREYLQKAMHEDSKMKGDTEVMKHTLQSIKELGNCIKEYDADHDSQSKMAPGG